MLNRNTFNNTIRRFETHGASLPGHIADLSRIRRQAMQAPNRGALDRNGVADRGFWPGQQQSYGKRTREGFTPKQQSHGQHDGNQSLPEPATLTVVLR
jgi:hypothetical protein